MKMRVITLAWYTAVPFARHIATVKAQKCAAPPLNLPIRSLQISPGTLSRGVLVSLGTPYQQLALTPSLQIDNTFIPYYTNSCVYDNGASVPLNSTRQDVSRFASGPGIFQEETERASWATSCAELYGGGFNPELSNTFHDNNTKNQAQEKWFTKQGYVNWHSMTDRFTFADYLEIYTDLYEALPEKRNVTTSFVIPDRGAIFGNLSTSALGLTPNSTLLKALHDEKIVPSISWSLTNESLCLGCIEDEVHQGNFQTFKPVHRSDQGELPCLLQTRVEALNYRPEPHTEGASVITKTFTACIDPGVTFLVLPSDAQQSLPGILKRNVTASYDDYTVFEGAPSNQTGVLTFKLEGGLQVNVTIPGVGDVNFNQNSDWRVPIGNGGWGAYGEGVPVLGKPFVDHLVLQWDEKAQVYGIANRNPDASNKADLKPLGCEAFPIVEKASLATPRTSVIVGSILGGFASGLLFAGAGVFFFRRGQRGVKSRYKPMRGEDTVALRSVSTDGRESRMSGALPVPSIRESLRSHLRTRSVSPNPDPQLVEDGQIFEAPEGGTAYPTKRERGELQIHSIHQR